MRLAAFGRIGLLWLKGFGLRWLTGFSISLGLASGAAQFFPTMQKFAAAIVGACVLIGTATAWRSTAKGSLPFDDLLPHAVEDTPDLAISCTTEREAVEQVHHLAREVYPGVVPIAVNTYLGFLRVNPTIFVCLRGRDGRVLGYFDVLPLSSSAISQLRSGSILESELTSDDILSPSGSVRATDLYLAGIAVRDRLTFQGRRSASMLVWALMLYLDHFYGSDSRAVWATAGSDEGSALLERFGWQQVCAAEQRRDQQALYRLSIDRERLNKLRRQLPDWSTAVSVSWQTPKPVLRLRRGAAA